jgi:KDO2-lipid IV(A) lauroyltransferase
MGHPAMTALSAAELALRYDAVVIPAYGLRQPDGLGFDLILEAPVPPDTPEAMTQALNRSLEAHVRTHMDQWLWTHRRW